MSPEETGSGAPPARSIQERVLDYWTRTGVVARALEVPASGPLFRFTEGPPTANGAPAPRPPGRPDCSRTSSCATTGCGATRSSSTMAGWDCHGLPVELEIEKRHGLKSKKEIETYGVERFCEECRVEHARRSPTSGGR